MSRWAIILLAMVAIPILLFGTIFSVVNSLIPQSQPSQVSPLVLAFAVTYAVVLGIATIAQAAGYTLRDLLPEKSLGELDRERQKLLRSNDPDLLNKQANLAYERKEWDWALAFAEALMKIRPKSSEAYEIAGRAANRLGKAEKAALYGEKLVELQKLSVEGYRVLGDAYSVLGDWEKAVTNLEMETKLSTPNLKGYALSQLSTAYMAIGELDKAVAALQQAADLPEQDFVSLTQYREQLAHLLNVKQLLQDSSATYGTQQ